ncbi:hypothetical protein RvY_18661-2 [Ramazzottius varieornatus]|uniref:Uncharacterized protein n=1 Tax=Ramazzottius varieornatus TaxID=947166 RepID=A0A1D1W828_RAMVA|nr:hypothetical protein RvY_18661-2 [Ramazzottius varieornatus]
MSVRNAPRSRYIDHAVPWMLLQMNSVICCSSSSTLHRAAFNHARRMVAVFLEKFQTGESLFPLADFFTFGTPTFGILTRMLSSLVADGDGGGTQFSEDVVKSTTGSMGDVLVESFLPIFCVWALRLLILDHD